MPCWGSNWHICANNGTKEADAPLLALSFDTLFIKNSYHRCSRRFEVSPIFSVAFLSHGVALKNICTFLFLFYFIKLRYFTIEQTCGQEWCRIKDTTFVQWNEPITTPSQKLATGAKRGKTRATDPLNIYWKITDTAVDPFLKTPDNGQCLFGPEYYFVKGVF